MSFAVGQYKATHVETASPIQLVVALYDGALRFMRQGAEAAGRKDHAKRGVALGKAYSIVAELRATLDAEKAPELCASLDGLYGFVLDRITESNVRCDADHLQPAIRVLDQLRSAWVEIAKGAAK